MKFASLKPSREVLIWFLVPLVVFLAIHFVLRMFLSNSLEPDDADLALFGQSLSWGYSDQPPLYAWFVWAAFQVFGVSIFGLTLVKTLVLGSIFVLLYALTFELTRDRRLAILTAFSPMLVPTFSWHSVSYLTHTNLLCTVTLATVYQTIRVRAHGSIWNYLLLGVVVGLGGITKYNYLIAVVALFAAAFAVAPYRRQLLNWRIVLSAAVAGVIVAPHALWLMENWGHITNTLAFKTGVGHDSGPAWTRLRGFGELAQNLILIPIVLVLMFAICFPMGMKRRVTTESETPAREGARLIEWFALAVLIWMLAQLALGGHRIHERWLQPFFLLLPVYLFTRLSGVELNPIRVRRYALCLGMCALAVTGARVSQFWLGGTDTGIYPMQMRFDDTATQLRTEVGDFDTILGGDREIAGNLKHCFPEKRTVSLGRPVCRPPEQGEEQSCLFVWNTVYGEEFPIHLEAVQDQLPEGAVVVKSGFVEVPPLLSGRRTNRLGYHLISLRPTTDQAAAR